METERKKSERNWKTRHCIIENKEFEFLERGKWSEKSFVKMVCSDLTDLRITLLSIHWQPDLYISVRKKKSVINCDVKEKFE